MNCLDLLETNCWGTSQELESTARIGMKFAVEGDWHPPSSGIYESFQKRYPGHEPERWEVGR
jgi:hypothetical protein